MNKRELNKLIRETAGSVLELTGIDDSRKAHGVIDGVRAQITEVYRAYSNEKKIYEKDLEVVDWCMEHL